MQDNELKNGQTVPPQDEAAQQAPADAPELPDLDLSAELAKAQAKAAENYDLYVRAVAEADNTRRRASEDVAKARKFGIEKFADSLKQLSHTFLKLEEKKKSPGKCRGIFLLWLKPKGSYGRYQILKAARNTGENKDRQKRCSFWQNGGRSSR